MADRKAPGNKEDLKKFKEEIVHQFHVISEDVISQVKQVAEGVATVNEKLDRRFNELRAEIDNKTQPIAQAVLELSGKVTALDGKVGNLDDKVVAFDGKVADLDGKVVALDGKVGNLDDKVVALDGKVADLDDKVVALDGKVADLDDKVVALDGKVGNLDDKVVALDGKVGNLDDKVVALDGKVAVIDGKVDRIPKELKTEIQETRQEVLAALKFSYAELDKRITTLEKEFLELKDRVEKIETRSISGL